MVRVLLLGALLAGCRSGADLDLLDRERLAFKAENERIRAEDLERDWRKARVRADTLSEQLLAVGRERDRLYVRYDALRSDLARGRRELAEARRREAELKRTLEEIEKRIAALESRLAERRAALEEREAEAAPAGGGESDAPG